VGGLTGGGAGLATDTLRVSLLGTESHTGTETLGGPHPPPYSSPHLLLFGT
jgi:hypothetical protein